MPDRGREGEMGSLTYRDLKVLAVLTGSMAISIYIDGIWGLVVGVVLIYIVIFYLIFFTGDK